jgi:energy-coupling factor transporter ATP-binding protein EcfA2
MQQRASICRALIHEPQMLLLDEPFGALDAFTREELWCILRDLQAEQKFNVILVTHDLRESVFLADTVYVMSKSPGRFVVRRDIDLPRPRDLEVTYTPSSRTSSTSCAAISAPCAKAAPTPLQPFLNKAHHETSKNRRALGSLAAVAADRPALADHLFGLRRLGIHLPQPLGHRPSAL